MGSSPFNRTKYAEANVLASAYFCLRQIERDLNAALRKQFGELFLAAGVIAKTTNSSAKQMWLKHGRTGFAVVVKRSKSL